MKLKFNTLAFAAMAVMATGAAHANFLLGNQTTFGSSSVAFVAISNDPTGQGGGISVALDMNKQFADFLALTPLNNSAGSFSTPGTSASWNFSTNTFTVNGVVQSGTTYAWSSPLASFLSSSQVTANGYQWGVIAGDSVNGTKSATNLQTGQNIMWSAAAIDFNANADIPSSTLSDGAGRINNYLVAQNNIGTNTTTVKGGATATGGDAFLGTTLALNNVGNFSADFGANNFLNDVGTTTYIAWANSTNPATIFALGAGTYANSDATFNAATAATFSWDGTVLTYAAPVPEPSTYAMLLAGLAAVGFVSRRRAGR